MKKPKTSKRKIVGSSWRVLAHRGVNGYGDPVELESNKLDTPSVFDELCIDDFFHIEKMSARYYHLVIGKSDTLRLEIWIGPDGKVHVNPWLDGGPKSGGDLRIWNDVPKTGGPRR